MAFSHLHFLDHLLKFWPLFVALFLLAIPYLAHLDLSMNRLSPSDAQSVQTRLQPISVEEPVKKVPYPLVLALVHYATTTITPQQTKEEIMVTANILSRRGPCNFLIFGLGFDSPLWHSLNLGGRTVFLEEDSSWIAQMAQAHPYLKAYHVNYTTMVSEADDLLAYSRTEKEICGPHHGLLQSECKLALKTLPDQIYNTRWDVIMIDAPRGYFPEAPGRMSAIFGAAVMAREGKRKKSTDILLHDIDRPVEKTFSTEFFCSKNLIEAVGKLWHFQIFGEGSLRSKDFCNLTLEIKRAV